MGCQLGAAAQTGPEACAFSLRGMRKKTAVLALGQFDAAHRAAVDAGGCDPGKKAAVKPGVAGLDGSVAGVCRQADAGLGLLRLHGIDLIRTDCFE